MHVLADYVFQNLLYLYLYCTLYHLLVGAVRFNYVSEESTGYLCEGGQSSYHLQCNVVNLRDGETVYWYRTTKYEETTAIYGDQRLLTDGLLQEEQSAYTIGKYPNEIEISANTNSGRFLHLNMYTCRVLNASGEILLSSSGLYLKVLFPPATPECLQKPLSPSIGSEIFLTCRSNPGNPPISLQWTGSSTLASLTGRDTTSTMLLNYSFILQEEDYKVNFNCTATWKNCDKGLDMKTCTIKIHDNESYVVLIACLSAGLFIIIIIILVVIIFLWKKYLLTTGFSPTSAEPFTSVNTVSATIETKKNPKSQPITGRDILPSDMDYMSIGYRQDSEYCTLQNIKNECDSNNTVKAEQPTNTQQPQANIDKT
ncbi:uncharacterized protein LOC117111454 [Anneissia japonica]|uniref:uncharacterized protein LOC117111454 n=1 Tax=Anneissia japonica TaxID=1529436 RepID=UPI0014257F63|nr:uncharacterized protein LOC117111454 [Anneissia japonica]